MARKRKTAPPKSDAAEEAYDKFAAEFVDLLLIPENDWLREYFLKGGFTHPVASIDELALAVVQSVDAEVLVATELLDAIQRRDRKYLNSRVRADLKEIRPPVNDLSRFLQSLDPSKLRKAIKLTENVFPASSGPTPKIPSHKYEEIAELGLQLAPVIEKLLLELDQGTRHSIAEMLQYAMKDHPVACAFLLSHAHRLEEALSDTKLYKRAAKIPQRARLLADALAGSAYDLSFRTSLDIVRSTRLRSVIGSE
jgi:hypothetical protein